MSKQAKATPARPRPSSAVDVWDQETDVIIVGYGGAGACAAIEAADAGAEVIVYELASSFGGSTIMSSAEIYMGGSGGTRVQRACGFSDTTEDMVDYMVAAAGPQADVEKIRNYCENSTAHFEWLTELGVPFRDSFHAERAIMCLTDDGLLYTGNEKAFPFSEHANPCPRGHNLHIKGDNGGPLLMKVFSENIQQRPSISVEYEARALTLITGHEGDVLGLVVRQDQKEMNVRARNGVVLCTGGFVMNRKMLETYAPELLAGNSPTGNPGDTGSGIQMGMAVGGAAINMHEGFISIPYYPPASITKGILINDKGQRFINEDVYHGRLGAFVLKQQSKRFYFVVTVAQYGDYERVGYMGATIAGTGETIQELEEELELRSGTLEYTLSVYNEDCEIGKDSQFHKAAEWLEPLEPPLVALDVTPGRGIVVPYFTLGGLDTLPTGEVVDSDRNPVPGLYAAGRAACGVVRRAEGYSSGMSVGDATFSGRLAGREAATRWQ